MITEEINKRPIPGYEGFYSALDDGRIYSEPRVNKRGQKVGGKLLRPQLDSWGYKWLSLCKDGKRASFRLHRLIALAFLGDPLGREVDHIDGNKLDNYTENLRYVTRSQNQSNRHKLRGKNTHVGVYRDATGKWRVQFRRKYYGLFESYDDAVALSDSVRKEYFRNL